MIVSVLKMLFSLKVQQKPEMRWHSSSWSQYVDS